jgi:hypothetical protein
MPIDFFSRDLNCVRAGLGPADTPSAAAWAATITADSGQLNRRQVHLDQRDAH